MTFILLLINLINYLDKLESISNIYLLFVFVPSSIEEYIIYSILLSQASLGTREKKYILDELLLRIAICITSINLFYLF